jgi:hypothetical protein
VELTTITALVGIIGGLITASRAVWEMGQNRKQRVKELRWKQASVGKQLIDEMHDDGLASAAMRMLDWDGRDFEVKKGVEKPIRSADVLSGLRTTDTFGFSDEEKFIRDCFDSFFFHVHLIEQSIRNELTTLDDVKFPLDYYGRIMSRCKEVFAGFMSEYGYGLAADFYSERLGMPLGPPTGLPPAADVKTLK